MTNDKIAFYVECGCCGHFHRIDLPGSVDCRTDSERFTAEELDAKHGKDGWDYLSEEDQLRAEETLEARP